MFKNAFTLLEFVFVIVIVGILAATFIPRMERDHLYEMAEQVVSHIKYTQHMAMTENVYLDQDDQNGEWHRARWHLSFVNGSCGLFYSVGSNRDLSGSGGSFTVNESAIDPLTRERIFNMAPVCMEHDGWYTGVLLGEKYNIVSIDSSCSTQTIAFDHFGRPYAGISGNTPAEKLMKQDCYYTFTDRNGARVRITVTAETGYSFITYID